MSEAEAVNILKDGIMVTLKISAPILGVAVLFGLVVAIIQTTTSIQEQTLTFVPKLLAIVVVLLIFSGYFLQTLMDYTRDIFAAIGKF